MGVVRADGNGRAVYLKSNPRSRFPHGFTIHLLGFGFTLCKALWPQSRTTPRCPVIGPYTSGLR
jgi:hypothetical protein